MSKYTSEDFPRTVTNRNIIITGPDGEMSTFKKEDAAYDRLKKAFREEDWDAVPAIMSPKTAVRRLSDDQMRVEGDTVILSDDDGAEWEVPHALSECIIMHIDQDLHLGGLMNFARNLRRNPSRRSAHQLFPWCESANLTITEDGCFLAWKRVRSDFKDVHSGTIDNTPGQVVAVERNMVDDDPNRHCSHGLHVCSWDYLRSFSGEKVIKVKVNPADVVAVPHDYNNTKMRVCKYEVLAEEETPPHQEAPVTGPLHRDYDDEEDYEDDYEDDFDDDDEEWY